MKLFPMRFCALVFCVALCFSGAVCVSSADAPSVSAKSAVLAEGSTGTVIFAKNENERLPMASTTKIMTALVAIENCPDLSRTVKIDSAACGIEGSSVYLKAGEKLSVEELLYALLLESANDSACAIAIEVAGTVEKFADMMNDVAARIGMTDTHFTNPHGLDNEAHYTTAADMAKLAVYALKNESFAKIVSTYKTTIPMNGDDGTRLLLNHNKLLKYYDGAIGVKTGFTKRSGRCLVSAAERDGVRMIAVTLSAPDDWNDHKNMLDYGFSKYRHIDIAKPGDITINIPVTGGTADFITVTNKDAADITLPSDFDEPRLVIEAPRFLYAPVKKDEIYGYACYYADNYEILRIPLTATDGCDCTKKPSLWKRILELYK